MLFPDRITCVISSLGSGGAERVMSTLSSYWAQQRREITLITLSSAATDFFALDPRVHRVALDVMRPSRGAADALRSNLARLKRLRAAIRESRPQIVLSFTDQTNVLTLLATRGLG